MKIWALLNEDIIAQIFEPMTYDAESPDWVEGDSSRIGNEIPITERLPPAFVERCVDITGVTPTPIEGWQATKNGDTWTFGPYVAPPLPLDQQENNARMQRDLLLRTVYDPGISMALRALRMASTDAQKEYASGKIVELDVYAESLVSVPQQSGFPQTIDWPVAPKK